LFLMALTLKALGSLVVKTAAVVSTTALIRKVVDNTCKNTCIDCKNKTEKR